MVDVEHCEETETETGILSLPADVLTHIASLSGDAAPMALASTCRSLRTSLQCDTVWRLLCVHRWPSTAQASTPVSALASLKKSAGLVPIASDQPTPEAPVTTWRQVYILWDRKVQSAVSEVLTRHLLPAQSPASSSLFAPLPSDVTLDYETAWTPALRALAAGGLGLQDVRCLLLRGERPALVNFLGLAHAVLHLRAPAEQLREMVRQAGIGDRTVSVRYWTLGSLELGAGWRTMDRMVQDVGPLLGFLQPHKYSCTFELLRRGIQNEVRRIMLVSPPSSGVGSEGVRAAVGRVIPVH